MWLTLAVCIVAFLTPPAITTVAAIGVPLAYALALGIFDFCVRYDLKGRKEDGDYRIWTSERDGWQMHTGGMERLASLYAKRGNVEYVEKSLRLSDANPYNFGLNLTLAALAVDVSALVHPGGNTSHLVYAFLCHVVFLVLSCLIVVLNQNAKPNERFRIKFTATCSVLIGFAAIALAYLLVEGIS